jgi:hypothetical protein
MRTTRIEKNIRLIGCGGVGGWIASALSRIATNVTLQDGDTVEHKNLDRQLFAESDIGKNKADALAALYGFRPEPSWFSLATDCRDDILIVAVDNNPCRVAALDWADSMRRPVIIAANETTSSEAYLYMPSMRGTPIDPRNLYPSLLTDHSGDPMSPCAALASANIQTAMANYQAAFGAVWLLMSNFGKRHTRDMIPYLPNHIIITPTHIHTRKEQT